MLMKMHLYFLSYNNCNDNVDTGVFNNFVAIKCFWPNLVTFQNDNLKPFQTVFDQP